MIIACSIIYHHLVQSMSSYNIRVAIERVTVSSFTF
jgi:hypothetical protein